MKDEIGIYISKLCDDLGLILTHSNENHYRISTENASGLSIFMNIEESEKLSFHYLIKTYDGFYSGDRTDVHVVLGLMFSAFLRLSTTKFSTSLFDIPHPVIENEIYGRYIMPEQINFSNEIELKEKIFHLITSIDLWRSMFWSFAGCPCYECMEKNNLIEYNKGNMISNNKRDYFRSEKFISVIENLYETCFEINYGSRIRPSYDYYYDMKNEVTVIKSKDLSQYIETLYKNFNFSPSILSGINGNLIIDDKIFNFISNEAKSEIRKLSHALTNESIKYPILPLENMLIALAKPYVIAIGRLSGFSEFKTEREVVRNRHNKEAEILFPIPSFIWLEKICPEEFENLIKSLLEREPNIKTVRKPAPINQGDKGRDLIIEWAQIDESFISKNHPPINTIKVVGQCKTSIKTIGKNKVLDIRDTVETHKSSGYFLAVNTQISAALTEKLESLREKKIWTSWWNRDDIEIRLSRNQDLIPKFPNVLKVKHKVKFVDKN